MAIATIHSCPLCLVFYGWLWPGVLVSICSLDSLVIIVIDMIFSKIDNVSCDLSVSQFISVSFVYCYLFR